MEKDCTPVHGRQPGEEEGRGVQDKGNTWQVHGGVTDTSVTGNKLFMLFLGRSGTCGLERRWLGGALTAPWTE